MQHLNTLWQIVNAASSIGELARQSQTFHFNVNGPITFYLQSENADVQVFRWPENKVEVNAQLQVAPGWRIATDQDDAGVYVVARRKLVVGAASSAIFSVTVPQDAYLLLKLKGGRVILEHVDGALHVPPPDVGREIVVRQS
jgi:hypothetical protein